MKQNSNYTITKAVVDPTSQELTSVYINGEEFSSGSGGNLQTIVYDSQYPLNVSAIFPSGSQKPGEVEITPDSDLGYDGIEKVTIQAHGLIGYPIPLYILMGQFHAQGEDDTKVLAFYTTSGGGGIGYITDNIDTSKPVLVPTIDGSNGWKEYDFNITQEADGDITVTISNVDWTADVDSFVEMGLYDSYISNI